MDFASNVSHNKKWFAVIDLSYKRISVQKNPDTSRQVANIFRQINYTDVSEL